MTTNMKFGECLRFLLSTLDISINRLSKAINVDCSLVNRWVHGSRIPAYNAPYIESISEYLSKNVLNTFQRHRLNELFLKVDEDNKPAISIKEDIKKALLESQGYSIESKKKERNEKVNHLPNIEQIKRKDSINNENFILNTNDLNHCTDLSREDKIILGANNVLAASIFLLEAAASKKCRNSNTIYITCNNDLDVESYSHNDLIHFRNALLKAINSGWNILLLLKLNNNINRTLRFINFAKPLIKTGRFNLYNIKKYDDFATGKEMIIVPEIGVLSCFSTSLHSEINSAFYLKNKAAIDIFKDYFNMLLTASAKPLIKYYSGENNMDYGCCLIEQEEDIGNRFLYKYCFSELTLPERLYEKFLKIKNHSIDEMHTALSFYKRRLNAFLLNVQIYEYKDIYMVDSIKDLIKYRQFYFYTSSGVERMNLEVQDIIELLHNIINLLETYENYSIAFMPQNTDATVKSDIFYCIVKDRQGILLETFSPQNSVSNVRLSIEEPMMIKALDEYFKELWEHIAPINKDKKEVVAWIRSQINLLRNKYL